MGEGWTSRLRKKCSCPNGVHAPLVLKVMVRAKGKTKKVNVTGKKGEPVMSGTFPPNLGRWIVKNWQETKGLDLKDEVAGPKRKCRTAKPQKLVKPKIAKPKKQVKPKIAKPKKQVQPKIAKPKKQVQPKTAKPNKATVRKAKQEPASAASSWKALSAAGSGIAASAAGSGVAATTSSWKSLSVSSSSSKPASSSGTSWKSLAP